MCNLNEPYFQNFCLNRGTCYIRLKREDYDLLGKSSLSVLAKIMKNQAYCSCLSGFTGSKCETSLGANVINEMGNPNVDPPVTRGPIVARAILPELKQFMFENKYTHSCNLTVCDKKCQFGYKIDYRTGCALCECINLELSECGVPCYLKNTQSCKYSNRANSRPMCVCHPNFEGVFCEKCNLFKTIKFKKIFL